MHNLQLRGFDLSRYGVHPGIGGIDRLSRSKLMQPVPMTEAEVADLKAFLFTLTGSKAQVPLPILPN